MKTARWFCLAGGLLCALFSHSGSMARAQEGIQPLCQAPKKQYGTSASMTVLRKRAWKLFSTIAFAPRPLFDSSEWVPERDAFVPPSKVETKTNRLTVFFAAELARGGVYYPTGNPPGNTCPRERARRG